MLSLLLSSGPVSETGALTVEIDLAPESLEVLSLDAGELPVLHGARLLGEPGMPALPGIPLCFVLPPGSVLDSVRIEVLDSALVGGRGHPLTVLGTGAEGAPEPLPPPPVVANIASGRMAGFSVGCLTLSPLRPEPGAGYRLLTSVRLEAFCSGTGRAGPGPLLSRAQMDAARGSLAPLVVNPSMLGAWAPPASDDQRELFSWAVIADESLREALAPLMAHRAEAGEDTLFVSLQEIETSCPGEDTQEKIRSCLTDLYWNHGLVYALIVGDHGRSTRLSSLVRTSGGIPMDTFTDLYYGDLDGDWDANGNGLYGEADDGVDYFADIHVGRLPSDDPAELSIMISRIIEYEVAPPGGGWRTRALLCGAGIVPELNIWGSDVCLAVWESFPDGWTSVEWFEDSTGNHPGPLTPPLEDGCSFLEIAAHGTIDEVGWCYPPTDLFSADDAERLRNGGMTPVVSSIACSVGNIDGDCLAEALLTASEGGAVAARMNSSSGLLSMGAQGPSELMDVYFADILLRQDVREIGIAHSISRHWLIASYGLSINAQWVMQELNLLGDPAMKMIAPQTGAEGTAPGAGRMTEVTVWPNPAPPDARLELRLEGETDGFGMTVTMIDLSGRLVGVWSQNREGGPPLIHLSEATGAPLAPGCYAILVDSGGSTASTLLTVVP